MSNHLSRTGLKSLLLWSSLGVLILVLYPTLIAAVYNNVGSTLLLRELLRQSLTPPKRQILGDVGGAEERHLVSYELSRAGILFNMAIKWKSKLPEAYRNLAKIDIVEGRLNHAKRHLSMAVSYDPHDGLTQVNLARVYWILGEHELALSTWQQSGLDPLMLGAEFEKLGLWEYAIEQYQLALQMKRGPIATAHYRLGMLLWRRKRDFQPAIFHLRRAVELQPHNASLYIELALALKETGRSDEAEDYLRKSIAIQPFPSAFHALGSLYYEQGLLIEAKDNFERGLVVAPTSWAALFHYKLGLVYKGLGAMDQAVQHWKQALELDPSLRGAEKELQEMQR